MPRVSGLGRRRALVTRANGYLFFALAGALVWAPLGAVLSALLPTRWAVGVAVVVSLAYGGAQLFSRGLARVPQRRWQVPRPWLEHRGPRGRLAVWAAMLGPGLATRNPYVSFWLLVPALGSIDHAGQAAVVGAVAGGMHGLARFGGIAFRQRERPDADWNLLAVLWSMRLQRIDGVLLLLLGTALVVALVAA